MKNKIKKLIDDSFEQDKLLIIVDMQNDFITGSLANPAAQAIVKPMVDFISKWGGHILCTRDTHDENYLSSTEGKNLPVPHCIVGTLGHQINKKIWDACVNTSTADVLVEKVDKLTFGYNSWDIIDLVRGCDEIVVVGTCTDICVISNVLILKAVYPEKKITVISSLCAGLTPEKHNAALEVMRSCQVEVI